MSGEKLICSLRIFWLSENIYQLQKNVGSSGWLAANRTTRGRDDMNPVEFDGIRIAVFDRPIGDRNCRVIHAGRGKHDGETFLIVSEDGDRVILSERLLRSI